MEISEPNKLDADQVKEVQALKEEQERRKPGAEKSAPKRPRTVKPEPKKRGRPLGSKTRVSLKVKGKTQLPDPRVEASEKAGSPPRSPEATPESFRVVLSLFSMFAAAQGAEPFHEGQLADAWCGSAAAVANKYGGELPYMDEIVLVGCTLIIGAKAKGEIVERKKARAEEAKKKEATPQNRHEERKNLDERIRREDEARTVDGRATVSEPKPDEPKNGTSEHASLAHAGKLG